jgi:DNA-binding HxlR family transcriptional regulator
MMIVTETQTAEVQTLDEGSIAMVGPLDPRQGWVASNCPVAAALEVVGTRSALLILREAFYGITRFDDFTRLVGLSDASTAARLSELVGAGLLERRPYKEEGRRTRMGYHLTEMGADFFPAFVALMQWGSRWLGPSRVELRHRGCGAPVGAQVRCAEGHEVGLGDTELGPRGR